MNLWVVGIFHEQTANGYIAWEFCGVFNSESTAVAECVTDRHFVAPIKLNERPPLESEPWPGCYYPLEKA